MALGEIIDFIGYSIEGLAGWRYLLSPSYRRRVHVRWRNQSKLETAGEIFTFAMSFIFVSFIIGGLAWWLLFNSTGGSK
jgi:hypothetical protein